MPHGRRCQHGRDRGARRRHRTRHQALTGSELAGLARVSRATASEHLSKLTQARLLTVTQKRRNRYYRIASPLVAKMLESIKAVAALETPPRYQPRSAQDDALRFARCVYRKPRLERNGDEVRQE